MSAKSLKRGELLRGANGQTHPVGGVSAPRKALVDLHNIEVEIDHTYFVGNPSILVHNGYDCIKVPAWEQELADADRLTVKSAEDALGGIHGNSLDATGEHSIYGIIDRDTGELLHIGETGDLETRLAAHARDFAKQGIDNISHVVFEVTEGKAAAKVIETELITSFKDLLGYPPAEDDKIIRMFSSWLRRVFTDVDAYAEKREKLLESVSDWETTAIDNLRSRALARA